MVPLIGGPRDGHRVSVDVNDRLPRLRVVVLGEGPFQSDVPDVLGHVIAREEATYTLRLFSANGRNLHLYAHECLSDFEVLESLVQGYGR